jgi:hypothetical protein
MRTSVLVSHVFAVRKPATLTNLDNQSDRAPENRSDFAVHAHGPGGQGDEVAETQQHGLDLQQGLRPRSGPGLLRSLQALNLRKQLAGALDAPNLLVRWLD